MEYAPKGLNEDIVRLISDKNDEPEWMTDWRLQAFKRWKQMDEPDWAMVDYPRSTTRTSITTPAQEHGGEAEVAGRGRSGAAAHL
jgi:Fe-S cluster assembly scaffold protein SufB